MYVARDLANVNQSQANLFTAVSMAHTEPTTANMSLSIADSVEAFLRNRTAHLHGDSSTYREREPR